MRIRPGRPWVVGLVGSLLAAAYVLRILIAHDLDPTIMLSEGEDASLQSSYAEQVLGREVVTRPFEGHDGRFFFAQANDPWLIDPATHAAVLDRPVYRAQRMLYPMLAGGFGAFPPGVVVWLLIAINILAVGLGTWTISMLATGVGSSPWLGLAFALNFGVISELDIDGAGVVACAAVFGAVLALQFGHTGIAVVMLTAGSLAREAMLAFALGLVVVLALRERRVRMSLLLVPAGVVGTWHLFIRWRLSAFPDLPDAWTPFSPPFVGIVEASRSWFHDGLKGLLVVVLILVVIAFTIRALRSRDLLAWGALPFVAVAVVLAADVWREPYDIARAIAPVLTAYPMLLLAKRGQFVSAQPQGHVDAADNN